MLPISVIVPTRQRPDPLRRMFESLAQQSMQPAELIVIDASRDDETKNLCLRPPDALVGTLRYEQAVHRGAATQRNQGVADSGQPLVMFVDDDIIFEPECIATLGSL